MKEAHAYVPEAEALARAHAVLLRDLRKLQEAIQPSSGEGQGERTSFHKSLADKD